MAILPRPFMPTFPDNSFSVPSLAGSIAGGGSLYARILCEEFRHFLSTPSITEHCLCKKLRRKISGHHLPRFSPHKCPEKPFSVLERRILPKAGENERTPFVFYSNPHHVQNPRLGTSFETI